MAGHGIWNGSISFGLVTIPVTLRAATEERELKFTMLDKNELSPVGYQHINKKTGKTVEWENIIKGYEYEDGKYVVMQPEDFEKANVKANRLLEIEDFVPRDAVDAIYYEKPYYVVPEEQGVKAYDLLREALLRTQKIGIGRVVLHTKYRLVAVIPVENVLVLEVLRFSHELRAADSLELPKAKARNKANAREVAMAQQIIDGLASSWKPEQYKDTYHDDLLRLIREKIKRGATAEIEPYNEPEEELVGSKGKVLDLMPLLQASLDRSLQRGPKKGPTERRPAAKKRSTAAAARTTRKRATARRRA